MMQFKTVLGAGVMTALNPHGRCPCVRSICAIRS